MWGSARYRSDRIFIFSKSIVLWNLIVLRHSGCRLNIPSSTATRFEPGDEREVQLVPYGGKRAVYGFNNLVDGPTAGQDAATVKSKAVAQRRGEVPRSQVCGVRR
jgi:hypothetical protein